MANAASSSAESEALKVAFDYLVNSINTVALLPKALSSQLISERQRSECATEPEPYKKAEKFLGHLQRAVNGDCSKYHTFIQVLKETGQASIASRLDDELAKANRSMPPGELLIVPSEEVLEELVGLRVAYARFLRRYKKVLQDNAEAQEEFVETMPGVIRRKLGPDHSFQSYFNTLIDEEVSLFNITYLKKLCDIFPDDVRTATKELVDKYEKQCQHFMASKTVKQFKALFPASATPSKLLTEKFSFELKFLNVWGDCTLDDLKNLVGLFGVPGKHLHLSSVKDSCIAVIWLCSTPFIKELKAAVVEATDVLQTKGVLKVFIKEELVLECSQSDQGGISKTTWLQTQKYKLAIKASYVTSLHTSKLRMAEKPFTTGWSLPAYSHLFNLQENGASSHNVKPQAECDLPISILLIGPTGNGKSSLGNFLLDPSDEHIWKKETFQTETTNKPATKEVKYAYDQKRNPSLLVIDTPGLNEGIEEDCLHMGQVVQMLKELKSIPACVFCIKFDSKIDAQYKATIAYYKKLLPTLFERNVIIVLTNFKTDARSVRMRQIQGVDVDVVECNTKVEVVKSAELSCVPQVFKIDSLPMSEEERRTSERCRSSLLDYIKQSLKPISIKDLRTAEREVSENYGYTKAPKEIHLPTAKVKSALNTLFFLLSNYFLQVLTLLCVLL